MLPNIKYTIYKTRRRSLMLKLKNDGTVAIYCPKSYPKKKALEFLSANTEKLLRLANERKVKQTSAIFGGDSAIPTLLYFGARYPVLYGQVKKLTFNGETFTAPKDSSLEDIRLMYKSFLRAEAKRVIPPLVSALAQKYGLSYNKIFIKDISSRFGSCSAKKNLNFSLALSAFCEEFISFIVLHELAHTVHLNHSDKFYLLLSRICPEHKRISKEYSKVYSNVLKAICS